MWQAGRKRDTQKQFTDSRVAIKVFSYTLIIPALPSCPCSHRVLCVVVRFAVI